MLEYLYIRGDQNAQRATHWRPAKVKSFAAFADKLRGDFLRGAEKGRGGFVLGQPRPGHRTAANVYCPDPCPRQHRNKASVGDRWAITLDSDGPGAPETGAAVLAMLDSLDPNGGLVGVEAIAYETSSSREGHRKWRVLINLSRPVDARLYSWIVTQVVDKLGGGWHTKQTPEGRWDPASKLSHQIMYGPVGDVEAHYWAGVPLDVDAFGEPPARTVVPRYEPGDGKAHPEWAEDAAAFLEGVRARFLAAVGGDPTAATCGWDAALWWPALDAARVVHAGVIAEEDGLAWLVETAQPWDEAETAKVGGTWRRALLATEGEAWCPDGTELFEPRAEELTDDLFGAEPSLTAIRDIARSNMTSPWPLLGAMLARVTLELPMGTKIHTGLGPDIVPNLQIGVVGLSGSGKTGAAQLAKGLIKEGSPCQEERVVGSGEGLIARFLRTEGKGADARLVLVDDPRLFSTVDEVSQLAAQGAREGNTFTAVFASAATGAVLGTANATADRDRHVPAGSYRLCSVFGMQVELSEPLVGEEQQQLGFTQRFVYMDARDPRASYAGRPPLPDWCWWTPTAASELFGGPAPAEPVVVVVPTTVVDEIGRAREAVLKGHPTAAERLASHEAVCRLKVALALAWLCRHEQEITQYWWALAGLVIAHSRMTIEWCMAELEQKRNERNARVGAAKAIQQTKVFEAVSQTAEARLARAVQVATRAGERHRQKDAAHVCRSGCVRDAIGSRYKEFRSAEGLAVLMAELGLTGGA